MDDQKWSSRIQVDPNDRVPVEIYIDTGADGEDFRVLSSSCIFTQGKQPCMGDPTQRCFGRYELCNNPTKGLCTDEVGRIRLYAKTSDVKLPSSIRTEWAKFSRMDWATRTFIDSQSYRFDPNRQERIFDAHRNQMLMVQCLLKEWSLGELDEQLVIQHGPAPTHLGVSFTMIPDDQMRRIQRVDSEIMKAFLDGYVDKTRG